ncbi:hypothetical protein [Corynebacterium riegelii]|uniref:hypothetical protein n=1 Tax=Corynebacterium riegelii TaxID=156976 RepID=UPI00288B05A2|nr:hypothetical protein [Corynebacterium riegelii]
MAWMTKNLALDLLAILIGAGQTAFDRIKAEPEGDWPAPDTPPAAPAAVGKPATATPTPEPAAEPAPGPATEPAPAEPESAVDPQAQFTEAKRLLQTIAQNGGKDWITGTLLPQFGVDKLSAVPADKYEELLAAAEKKAAEQ